MGHDAWSESSLTNSDHRKSNAGYSETEELDALYVCGREQNATSDNR
jgi:hypothetical protein